jgi:hypothetical protein
LKGVERADQGRRPLNLLVTDFFAGGGLRGYARVDEAQFAAGGKSSEFGTLVGEGALAITIEQKGGAQALSRLRCRFRPRACRIGLRPISRKANSSPPC